ncbi:MAG: hypothetical protein JXQ65_10545 [Candidatus Marinimicrobia bacterium]|nr:hypothetical protein [Candidatus Neomarinimicrobiota bacterium]
MSTYQLKITALSNIIIGNGEGFGTVIDTDVCYDSFGIPFIPAKRIKGILKDSAVEVNEMMDWSGQGENTIKLKSIFGDKGKAEGSLKIGNAYIDEYDDIVSWLKYLLKGQRDLLDQEAILKHFTEIRFSTAIVATTGIAKDHSLNTSRSIKKGNVFFANVDIDDEFSNQLALICQNVHKIGTKRNRGYGEVILELYKNTKLINKEAIKALVR